MIRFYSPLTLYACLLFALLLQPVYADTRPFAWQVSDTNNTLYVLGSVHVGSSDFYPLAPTVETAFEEARVLAVEADPRDPQGMAAVLARGFYPAGDTLGKHLPAPLLERLGKQLPRYGLTLEAAQGMKPFMVLTMLEMGEAARAGHSADQGVDVHFLTRATRRGMKIVELESIGQQLALMESFSDEESRTLLEQVVRDIESGQMQTDLTQTIAAWRAGDAARLERVVAGSMSGTTPAHATVMEKMNYARNANMVQKVEGYLKSGETHFVVVGALHLVGDRGLLSLLRKKGYTIKQL